MSTENAILSVRGISKSFGNLRAVDNVDFDVSEGEIFGIAGPNGAGKTTLFNLITGIPFRADTGEIDFDGQSIARLPPHKIFKRGVARTFQKESAFDSLTVAENVRVAAAFGGHGKRRTRSRDVEAVLEAVDLTPRHDETAGTLPLYAKKRLMVATALVIKPRLLMLDEPGAGLNAVELDEFMQLVLKLNAGGLTVIVIEHVLPLLFGVSHRLMIMDAGAKIAEGAPEVVARDDDVIEAYLGERGKQVFHAVND